MKKLFCLMIVSLLLIQLLPFGAAAVPDMEAATDGGITIANGDFSQQDANGMPEGWQLSVGKWNENVGIKKENGAHENVLRLWGDQVTSSISQTVNAIKGGAAYALTFDVKSMYGDDAAYFLDFYKQDGETLSYIDKSSIMKEIRVSCEGEWETVTLGFTPPSSASAMRITVRLSGSGEMYFDNFALSGGEEAGEAGSEEEPTGWQPLAVESDENLLPNADFEEVENGWVKGYGRFSAEEVFLNTDPAFAHSGSNSIHINSVATNLPWANVTIMDLEGKKIVPGGEYELGAWFYAPNGIGTTGFKIEGYDLNMYGDVLSGTAQLGRMREFKKEEGWVYYSYRVVLPEKTDKVSVLLRTYAIGEVYIDEVSLKLVRGPEAITKFLTDGVFYYNDLDRCGTATAYANTVIYPDFIGAKCSFALRDKSMILFSEDVPMSEEGTAEFRYPLSLLEEDWKPYNVHMEFYGKDGELITTKEEEITRCPRPNYLTKEGYYSDDGGKTIFEPMTMYHLDMKDFEYAAKAGVNVVQGYPTDAFLEACMAYNMKAFMVLYTGGGAGGISAGAPERIENTKAMVAKYKDHPAVFAWALLDEPGETQLPYLKIAFEEIRKIDPNHPIWITDSIPIDRVSDYTDIMCCDVYPYGLKPFTTADYENMVANITTLNNEKPAYDLLQMFDYRESFPTADEVRNMLYQAYWAGTTSAGGYSWSDCSYTVNDDGTTTPIPLQDTQLYEPLISFHELEKRDVLDHFLYKKYPTFCEVREENAWYRAWVKGDGLQLVVLNKADKSDTPVDIVLTSADGSVTVSDFSATVVNGAEKTTKKSVDGKLSLTLTPGQTILFNITPNAKTDFSGIVSSRFIDMYTSGWAQRDVKELDENGILYTNGHTFRPTEEVTRGDFIYMLARTLKLEADKAESFADVDFRDYYAKEVAASKNAGIINGMGDNTFAAENPITRQDLMTICARALTALNKAGNVEEAPDFADMDQVADYAKEAVGMMAGLGIVQGRENETVAPLDTTTRAEAAVIMNRIRKLIEA